jgi:DNA-directed RNA polymerase subunit RPC12/RpoP
MKLSEKVAYLKGLAEGLELEAGKETKLLTAIIDTLEDAADEMNAINERTAKLETKAETVSDELDTIEKSLFSMGDFDFDDEDDEDDDDWCDCDDDDDEDDDISIECAECGETISIEEGDLVSGSVKCSKCGAKLELDFSDDDDE